MNIRLERRDLRLSVDSLRIAILEGLDMIQGGQSVRNPAERIRDAAINTDSQLTKFQEALNKSPSYALLEWLYFKHLDHLLCQNQVEGGLENNAAYLNSENLLDFDGSNWTSDSVNKVVNTSENPPLVEAD